MASYFVGCGGVVQGCVRLPWIATAQVGFAMTGVLGARKGLRWSA